MLRHGIQFDGRKKSAHFIRWSGLNHCYQSGCSMVLSGIYLTLWAIRSNKIELVFFLLYTNELNACTKDMHIWKQHSEHLLIWLCRTISLCLLSRCDSWIRRSHHNLLPKDIWLVEADAIHDCDRVDSMLNSFYVQIFSIWYLPEKMKRRFETSSVIY